MSEIPSLKRHYTYYRGRVSDLEGSQTYALSSWARFTLGFETVQVHGLFINPPKLKDGDEVVVAGRKSGDRFHAKACFKPSETTEEATARNRGTKLRNYFWWGLLAAFTLVFLVLELRDPDHYWRIMGIAAPPALALTAAHSARREAELELALAVATGQVEEL